MTLIEEFNDPANKFYLSTYGSIFALGFAGKQDFIDRSFNMAHNHGIASSELKFLEQGFYFCRVKSRENLANGLRNYFINEIKFLNEIPLLKDELLEKENEDGTWECEYILEYNETEIEELAESRLAEFMEKFIAPKNFMVPPDKEIDNTIYEVSYNNKRTGSNKLSDFVDFSVAQDKI